MINKTKLIPSGTLLLIINCLLAGCATKVPCGSVTIPIQEYSIEDRVALADKLDEINSDVVDKFIGDYKNLRDKVRALNTK